MYIAVSAVTFRAELYASAGPSFLALTAGAGVFAARFTSASNRLAAPAPLRASRASRGQCFLACLVCFHVSIGSVVANDKVFYEGDILPISDVAVGFTEHIVIRYHNSIDQRSGVGYFVKFGILLNSVNLASEERCYPLISSLWSHCHFVPAGNGQRCVMQDNHFPFYLNIMGHSCAIVLKREDQDAKMVHVPRILTDDWRRNPYAFNQNQCSLSEVSGSFCLRDCIIGSIRTFFSGVSARVSGVSGPSGLRQSISHITSLLVHGPVLKDSYESENACEDSYQPIRRRFITALVAVCFCAFANYAKPHSRLWGWTAGVFLVCALLLFFVSDWRWSWGVAVVTALLATQSGWIEPGLGGTAYSSALLLMLRIHRLLYHFLPRLPKED